MCLYSRICHGRTRPGPQQACRRVPGEICWPVQEAGACPAPDADLVGIFRHRHPPSATNQVKAGQPRSGKKVTATETRSLGQDIYIGQGHINLYRLRSHKSGSKSVDSASLNAVQCTFRSVKLNSIQVKVQVNDAINLR